jgi:hypothetical protein
VILCDSDVWSTRVFNLFFVDSMFSAHDLLLGLISHPQSEPECMHTYGSGGIMTLRVSMDCSGL